MTVVDDGSIHDRRGSLSIDDEGTPTQENILIEDGILKGYIQDRLNARLMGVAPTGNGRRESFAHAPMPRMTNTFMRGGNDDPAGLLAGMKKGIFAKSFGGGQVDIVSGKFVFSCTEAYLVENGQHRRADQGRDADRRRAERADQGDRDRQRFRARRRHRHVRQGRAVGARGRGPADLAGQRADGRRDGRVNAALARRHGGVTQGWPALDWAGWRESAQHLHLMTQIVGKVRLAHTPWLNHGWHVALYPGVRGLGTGPIPVAGGMIALEFDFIADQLLLSHSDGGTRRVIALQAGSIADFHAQVLAALAELGAPTRIDPRPSEIPDAERFDRDTAVRPYDAAAVRDFHTALLSVARVFGRFRTGFLGKSSPVHFFWGSFDLAHTRFSGRVAPLHPGGVPGLPDAVTCEAYSHEEASAGFWPGSDAYPRAAFYAYAYPAPPGYAAAAVAPGAARYDTALGEFMLDYDAVRAAPDPEAALFEFLQSSYDAAATLADWDRAALECPVGRAGVPRRGLRGGTRWRNSSTR